MVYTLLLYTLQCIHVSPLQHVSELGIEYMQTQQELKPTHNYFILTVYDSFSYHYVNNEEDIHTDNHHGDHPYNNTPYSANKRANEV